MKPKAKIKVQKTELQNALAQASKTRLPPSKCRDLGFPVVFSCFVFTVVEHTPEPSDLAVMTTDSEMLTEIRVSMIEREGTVGRFALRAEEILYVLRRLDSQELIIHLYEYQAIFHHSFGQLVLPLVKEGVEAFLEKQRIIRLHTNPFSLELEAPFFLSILNRLYRHIDVSPWRNALNGINIRRAAGKIDFVASDGHRLIRITKNDQACMLPASILIPNKAITILRRILPRTGFLTIEYSISNESNHEKIVYWIRSKGLLFCFSPIDDKFPDFSKVIPTSSPHTCCLEKNMLSKALDRIGYFASNRGIVSAKVEKGYMHLYGKDDIFSTEAYEKIECKHTGDSFQFGLNTENVREVLNSLRCKNVIISAGSRERAIVVSPDKQPEDEHITALFMPCMCDQDFDELYETGNLKQ